MNQLVVETELVHDGAWPAGGCSSDMARKWVQPELKGTILQTSKKNQKIMIHCDKGVLLGGRSQGKLYQQKPVSLIQERSSDLLLPALRLQPCQDVL